MLTSFENLEKQWKEAEKLNQEFLPKLHQKAKELNVGIILIHDSIELVGLIENQNKLVAWVKDYLDEHPR